MPSQDFLLEVNPVDAISLSGFARRDKYLRKSIDACEVTPDDEDDKFCLLNQIEVIPKPLLVQQSEHWKNRDTSKIKDFEVKKAVSDWTFSTPYKGSISLLSVAQTKIKNYTGLELQSLKDGKIKCEVTQDQIPY